MDVVYDSKHNRYLVSNYTDGRIISINNDMTHSLLLETGGNCKSLDLIGDSLYVAVDSRVVGYLLPEGVKFLEVQIPTEYGTAGVAADSSGHVYVTAPIGRVFRVTVSDSSYVLLSDSGLDLHLHNCAFDFSRDALMTVEHQTAAPIKVVDPGNGMVSCLIPTEIGEFEGISADEYGNIFVASYQRGGSVYRFSTDSLSGPVLLADGLSIPSGLDYSADDDILAVCLYEANKVFFLPDASIAGNDSRQQK
jgi:hypothetical protein